MYRLFPLKAGAKDLAASTAAYYRVAQRDYDGTVAYSSIVFVPAPPLPLVPNPAHGPLRALVLGAASTGPVQVLDALGRLRLSQAAAGAETTLSVGSLPAGLYLVQIQTGAGRLVQRLVEASIKKCGAIQVRAKWMLASFPSAIVE